jgi:hypothetical protein
LRLATGLAMGVSRLRPSWTGTTRVGGRTLVGAVPLILAVAALAATGWLVRTHRPKRDPATGAEITYEGALKSAQRACREPIDLPPGEWTAPTRSEQFRDLPLGIDADHLPAPATTPASDSRIRPLPYPYYRAVSIVSDCCATRSSDLFYTGSLLSRKYGLDVGGSFFPYTSMTATETVPGAGGLPALFWGDEPRPRTSPVKIESGTVDLFPLLLTYYYRGWVDHFHNWSAEASSPGTVVAPQTLTLDESGSKTTDLTVCGGVLGGHFEGLQVSLEASEGVESFELSIRDQAGHWHHLVRGTGLNGRAGWDVTATPRDQLGTVWLPFAKEQNPLVLRTLERGGPDGHPLQAARLRVTGKAGATVAVKAMRLYDVSREDVARQLELMKHFNVLPACQSYHGGFTSWTNLLDPVVPITLTSPKAGGGQVTEPYPRPPFGAVPSAPTYYADLLRQASCCFLSRPDRGPVSGTETIQAAPLADGSNWYQIKTRDRQYADGPATGVTPQDMHGENIGHLVGNFLATPPRFGERAFFYTHLNFFNAGAFEGEAGSPAQMHQVKRFTPQTERALELLANLQYDLDGRRAPHQRVWVAPLSVQARHWRVAQELGKHTSFDGDTVRVTSWRDAATGQTVPDPAFPALDLHGQTVYVTDPAKTHIFLDGTELTALQRNPPDHTGRPSVTIVDTGCANVVFDELDLYEQTGRVVPDGASYFFRTGPVAKIGKHAAEVRAERAGPVAVHWEPFRLDSHETGYVHLSFKKTNPAARARFSWTLADGTETVVAEDDLGGHQGWKVGPFEDTEYHELVLAYSDMVAPAGGSKRPPRGEIARVSFGLKATQVNDSVLYDGVEFLSARGVRPHAGTGLVIGGRLHPPLDGQVVTMKVADRTLEALTERGGWFAFHDVPPGAVAEIRYERDRVTYFPVRGRLLQPKRNDLEYHIFATDSRSPFVPRPPELINAVVPSKCAPRSINFSPDKPNEHEALYAPHSQRYYAGLPGKKTSYVVEDPVNNLGFIDRDRRFDNPDRAVRILLQGECWTEGSQTLTHQHMNVLLESILRRRYGVPVDVIVTASSSSSPASYSLWFEKYGAKFDPDLVLMFLNPFNMTHLEPTMLRKLIGWDPEHSPYRMFDVDAEGRLLTLPPDKGFSAYATNPDPAPVLGHVPLASTHEVVDKSHPLVDRGFDLLRAILRHEYKARPNGRGTVGLIYGYDHAVPPYGTVYGDDAVAAERWFSRVEGLCNEEGLAAINLRRYVSPVEEFKTRMLWENDNHLNSAANVRFAEGLAEEISKLPQFQAAVERYRKGIPAPRSKAAERPEGGH